MHNLIDDQMQNEVIGHLASTAPTSPISPDFAQTSDTTPLRGPLRSITSTLHSAAPIRQHCGLRASSRSPHHPRKFRPRRRSLDAVVRLAFRALVLPATVSTYSFILIIKQTPTSGSRCSVSDRDLGSRITDGPLVTCCCWGDCRKLDDYTNPWLSLGWVSSSILHCSLQHRRSLSVLRLW